MDMCISLILTFINLIITTLLQNYFVTLTCACNFNMVVLAFWESLSLNLALNASLQQK